MGILRFALSDKNLDLFEEWLASHFPTIIEVQRKIFERPNLNHPEFGMTMYAFVNHIKPLGTEEWEIQITFYRAILPEVTPLILTTGITPVDTYAPSPPDETATDMNSLILERARYIIQELTISHGFYDHLERIGWSIDKIRDFEYQITPSGLGSSSQVRLLGTDEWITLEDPNYEL